MHVICTVLVPSGLFSRFFCTNKMPVIYPFSHLIAISLILLIKKLGLDSASSLGITECSIFFIVLIEDKLEKTGASR